MDEGLRLEAKQYSVKSLVDLKRRGQIQLPDLQRGFVWDNERVRLLFDSLYRRYPVGSLLLWVPRVRANEDAPISTRPWDVYPPDRAGLGKQEVGVVPTDGSVFVLDGQQRLTSLFRVVFDSRKDGKEERDPPLLVALSTEERCRESPFLFRNKQITKTKRAAV